MFSHNMLLYVWSLQENASLITNSSDQKLLVTIVKNFNTNSQSRKLLVTKIVTIMNKNYNWSLNCSLKLAIMVLATKRN